MSLSLTNNIFYRSEPQAGYTLGDPTQRELHPASERNLSPAACAILRILVNACLVWTACTNEVVYLPVSKLIIAIITQHTNGSKSTLVKQIIIILVVNNNDIENVCIVQFAQVRIKNILNYK